MISFSFCSYFDSPFYVGTYFTACLPSDLSTQLLITFAGKFIGFSRFRIVCNSLSIYHLILFRLINYHRSICSSDGGFRFDLCSSIRTSICFLFFFCFFRCKSSVASRTHTSFSPFCLVSSDETVIVFSKTTSHLFFFTLLIDLYFTSGFLFDSTSMRFYRLGRKEKFDLWRKDCTRLRLGRHF